MSLALLIFYKLEYFHNKCVQALLTYIHEIYQLHAWIILDTLNIFNYLKIKFIFQQLIARQKKKKKLTMFLMLKIILSILTLLGCTKNNSSIIKMFLIYIFDIILSSRWDPMHHIFSLSVLINLFMTSSFFFSFFFWL